MLIEKELSNLEASAFSYFSLIDQRCCATFNYVSGNMKNEFYKYCSYKAVKRIKAWFYQPITNIFQGVPFS